jgi:hypothetical protein
MGWHQQWLKHEVAESLFILHVLAECQGLVIPVALLPTELVKPELTRWFETLPMKLDSVPVEF